MRQDLCIRHRERHTTRGSQLQKRDSFTADSHDDNDPPKSLIQAESPSSPTMTATDYQFMAEPRPSSKSPPSTSYPLSTGIDTTGIPVSGYTDFSGVLSQPENMLDFDSMSNAYPIFGGETYNRSPFAMADDFAAWLFSEPMAPLG